MACSQIGYTLFFATPLIFTGLAVAVAFRCGLLNIGAEGQLYVAAFADGVGRHQIRRDRCHVFGKQEDWSWAWLPRLSCHCLYVDGSRCRGHVGRYSGHPQSAIRIARSDQHDHAELYRLSRWSVISRNIITSSRRRDPADGPIGEAAHIPRISQFIPGMPDFVPLSVAFLMALLMCVLVYVFLWKTKWGMNCGPSVKIRRRRNTAELSPKKQIVIAMSYFGRTCREWSRSARYWVIVICIFTIFSGEVGILGIAVALLGRNHPVGVFFAAHLFRGTSTRRIFCRYRNDRFQRIFVEVLQAIVILFVASLQRFSKK